jgi:hypothetical protein
MGDLLHDARSDMPRKAAAVETVPIQGKFPVKGAAFSNR